MQQLHFMRSLLSGLLLLAASSVTAQSLSLDSLPQESQDEISRICLPVQFREGAGAYRNCVQAELDLRTSGQSNELAKLSFDDKYAVQQACAKAGGQSSTAYQNCVNEQISELKNISAPVFDNVSEDELYMVQQTCFDAQSKQGAASYRQCLNTQVQSLTAVPAADTSKLNMLKKNALQLRCSANATTAAEYRQCIVVEFESIAGVAPNFVSVGTATQVVRTSEVPARKSLVNETVAKIAETKIATEQTAPSQKPEPIAQSDSAKSETSTPAVMALPRNINPQAASKTNAPIALDQPSVVAKNTLRDATGDNPDTTTTLASTPTALNNVQPRVISKPGLVEAVKQQQRAEAQGIDIEEPASTTTNADSPKASTGSEIMPRLSELWQKFLDSLASLDSLGWLIIAGVLALPALLLGIFSLVRRTKQPVEQSIHNTALTDRIEPGMHTRKLRHEREAAELFGDPENAIQNDQPALHEHPTPQALSNASPSDAANQNVMPTQTGADQHDIDSEHDAVTRIAMKSEQPVARVKPLEQTPPESPPSESPIEQAMRLSATNGLTADQSRGRRQSNIAWQSAFGHWLTQQPESDHMELCIEFLIYWVAYGDERYEPDLKKRLFTANDLNKHDQIKRWVLKQDVFAFSDVIGWLRTNASQTQLDQSLSLIMALLITENSVTPVQNTLLRFLSDAFNIGKDQLESRFEAAYGHTLPPMPRPDKQAWWDKQDQQTIQRWNSRAMASRPERDQMIARLGLLPDFDESQVINAFRRAARRCHPDRFTALGERERALAEQRFITFEQARDKLLGVSV